MFNYESEESLKQRHELLVCLEECWYAAFQVKRFLNGFESFCVAHKGTSHDISLDIKSRILRLDAFYAITSLSIARKYLNITHKNLHLLDDIIDQLNQNENWKHIKDARDILTHKEEYAAGSGKHRDKYFQSNDWIEATMDSVVIIFDRKQYLVGANLDLVNVCNHYLAVYRNIYDLISAQIGYRDIRYDFSILSFH